MGSSSVNVKTQKTTRDLLAQFAGNQRMVKLFENLAQDVSINIPFGMDQLQEESESTRALAVLVQGIANAALTIAMESIDRPASTQVAPATDDAPLQPPLVFEGIAIGGIYMTVDSADPSTTLGYGVWVAWGAGRFPVGFLALDPDFGIVEATGGAKTKAISAHTGTAVANHAAHTHLVTSNVTVLDHASHTHLTAAVGTVSQPTFTGNPVAAGSTQATPDLVAADVTTAGVSPVTTATGTVSQPTFTGAPVASSGPDAVLAHAVINSTVASGNPSITLAHAITQPDNHVDLNVLSPFIVAYFWKRTA